MSLSNATMERDTVVRPPYEVRRECVADRGRDTELERSVVLEPQTDPWKVIASGTVVPLGLSVAAAITTYLSNDQRTSMTAWIAVAVVGTASVVSAASVSRRRIVTVERDNHVDNSTMREAGRQR